MQSASARVSRTVEAARGMSAHCVMILVKAFLNVWTTTARLHVQGGVEGCIFGCPHGRDGFTHYTHTCEVLWPSVERAGGNPLSVAAQDRLDLTDPAHVRLCNLFASYVVCHTAPAYHTARAKHPRPKSRACEAVRVVAVRLPPEGSSGGKARRGARDLRWHVIRLLASIASRTYSETAKCDRRCAAHPLSRFSRCPCRLCVGLSHFSCVDRRGGTCSRRRSSGARRTPWAKGSPVGVGRVGATDAVVWEISVRQGFGAAHVSHGAHMRSRQQRSNSAQRRGGHMCGCQQRSNCAVRRIGDIVAMRDGSPSLRARPPARRQAARVPAANPPVRPLAHSPACPLPLVRPSARPPTPPPPARLPRPREGRQDLRLGPRRAGGSAFGGGAGPRRAQLKRRACVVAPGAGGAVTRAALKRRSRRTHSRAVAHMRHGPPGRPRCSRLRRRSP